MNSIRETLNQLDEITRRDLLKGAGAAAAGAATSKAGAGVGMYPPVPIYTPSDPPLKRTAKTIWQYKGRYTDLTQDDLRSIVNAIYVLYLAKMSSDYSGPIQGDSTIQNVYDSAYTLLNDINDDYLDVDIGKSMNNIKQNLETTKSSDPNKFNSLQQNVLSNWHNLLGGARKLRSWGPSGKTN